MKKVKDKIIEIIIGVVITAVLLWIGGYVRFIPELKEKFPIIQTTNDRQDECISDLQKAVNGLRESRKMDSVAKATYQKIKHKH